MFPLKSENRKDRVACNELGIDEAFSLKRAELLRYGICMIKLRHFLGAAGRNLAIRGFASITKNNS